jgi:hypothetical protein
MGMDRDRFDAVLDRVIKAHGRKVRAGIDAAACGTRYDWDTSHEADDAYEEARGAFTDKVLAEGVDVDVAEETESPTY